MTYNPRPTNTDVSPYMRSIERYSRITPEREQILADIIQNSTDQTEVKNAKTELICANLKLVVKIAHDFKKFGLSMDDLIAEGNKGLITAADKFTSGAGAKFSYYASLWIKQAMRKAVAEQTRTVRVPVGQAQRYIRMDKYRCRYKHDYGKMPTPEEVAKNANVPLSSVLDIDRCITSVLSMDEKVNSDSDTEFNELSGSVYEQIEQEPEVSEEVQNRLNNLRPLMKKLPDNYREFLCNIFGIGCQPSSILEAGQELGLTINKAKNLYEQLLGSLKSSLSSDAL